MKKSPRVGLMTPGFNLLFHISPPKADEKNTFQGCSKRFAFDKKSCFSSFVLWHSRATSQEIDDRRQEPHRE